MVTYKYCQLNTDLIEVDGNVIYHESTGSWNTLRLNKRIVWEIPLLKQRGTKIGYRAVLARTMEKIKEMMLEVKQGKLPPPLMVFFFEQEK